MNDFLVSGVRKLVEKTAGEFDPGALDITTAERAVSDWAAIERVACAAKLRSAARAEEIGLDAASAVADASGVTSSQARRQTRLNRKLKGKPKTTDSFNRGRISSTQAEAIADAANANPDAEDDLVDMAESGASTSDLLNECARIRRDALDADGTLAAKQRQARSLRHWTDAMGMTCGFFRLQPVPGAKFIAEVERTADRAYRQQSREKRAVIDTPEQLQADALMDLVTSSSGGGRRRGPRTVVQLHVTKAAAERGYTEPGEKCHTADGKPIPMGAVDEALLDRDTKVQGVTFDEVDVQSIVTYTRYIPARLRDAMAARGLCCEVPGCGQTKGLQRDHAQEFAKGGPTSAANLGWKCRYHHDLKTRGLYQLRRDENGQATWESTRAKRE